MKVSELMELLEEMPEDAEVRIAYQPNYPLQVALAAVTDLTKAGEGVCLGCGAGVVPDHDECSCNPDDLEDVSDDDRVVWIAAGNPTGTGYAPSSAWDGNDSEW